MRSGAAVIRAFRKMVFITRRRGVRGLLRLLYDYYGRRHRFLVYKFDSTRSRQTLVPRDPALRVSIGTLAELQHWRQTTSEVPLPLLRDWSNGWSDFWWAWYESRLAGIVWVVDKPPLLHLEPNGVAICDLYTIPAFRGRGVGKALVLEACRAMPDRGATQVYAAVDPDNMPSRRVFETLGFSIVAHLAIRGVFRNAISHSRHIAPLQPGLRMSANSMLRNVLSNWTAMALAGAISVFLMPFMIRTLGDFHYGLWILVASLIDYYGVLDFGLRSAIQRFAGHLKGRADRAALNDTLATAIAMTVGVGVLLLFLTAALTIVLPPLFGVADNAATEFRWLVLLYGLTVAVMFPARGLGAYLCGLHRFDLYNATALTAQTIRAILIFLLLSHGYGVLAVGAAGLSSAAVALVFNFVLVRKIDPDSSIAWRHTSAARMWSLVTYGFYSFLAMLGDTLRLPAQSMAIASRLTIGLITHFSVANTLMTFSREIVNGVAGPLLPRLSELDGEGNSDAFRTLFLRATKATALVSSYLAVLIILNGDTILRLWVGERFVGSYPLLVILTCAYVATLSQYPARAALQARNRHHALGWWTLVESGLNLGLSMYWAGQYGLQGVAWGTALPMLVTSLVIVPISVTRLVGLTIVEYASSALVRPAAVGGLLLGFVSHAIEPHGSPGIGRLAFTVGWQTLGFWILAVGLALDSRDRRQLIQQGSRFVRELRHLGTRVGAQATSGVDR